MDREGALPDRCVACNTPAGGRRLQRRLYRSPLAWRIGAFAAPFVAFAAGVALNSEVLMVAFWPLAILLAVAHLFVRRSLKLALGVCGHHRRLRYILIALSVACMSGVFAGIFTFRSAGPFVLLGCLLGLVVLVVVQSYVGVQSVRLKELSPEHAWLSGTGDAFRSGLPELS